MLIACPKCGHAAALSATECPECGLALTLGSVLGLYAQRLGGWLRRVAVTRCPACGVSNPISAKQCAACGVALTVQLAFEKTTAPARRHWGYFVLDYAPQIRWLLQGTHLFGSLALFLWLLGRVNTQDLIPLALHAAITAVYVAVLVVISLWIVPRPVQSAVAHRTTAAVRVGLIFNLLSLVLGLQFLVARWWLQALIVTGVIVVLCVAAYLLSHLLWPRVAEVRKVFQDSQQAGFDPSAPQGRKATLD